MIYDNDDDDIDDIDDDDDSDDGGYDEYIPLGKLHSDFFFPFPVIFPLIS